MKFEGTSVIEGIKELASQGFAKIPLPPHLANVHSLCGNQFLLTDRKKSDHRVESCVADSSYQHLDTEWSGRCLRFTAQALPWCYPKTVFSLGVTCCSGLRLDTKWSGCCLRGCLHDTGTSFIVVWNLISYCLYMGAILLEWHELSREPFFPQVILEHCCLSTCIRYLSQSTQPHISYQNETLYLLYMIPVQNVVRFHTGTNISYQYENRS